MRSYITRKKTGERRLLAHRYKLIRLDEDDYIEKEEVKDKYSTFKEILEAFKPPKIKFPIWDERGWELKCLLNKQIYNEKWKQIKGSNYSVSDYGRIRNDKTNKIKSIKFHVWSYQVDIYVNGKRYTCEVARLVANYFIREINKNERVRHTDGDARNNYYKNLRIVSK